MTFLTEIERRALHAIVQTLMPPVPTLQSDLGTYDPLDNSAFLDDIEAAYEAAVDDDARRELKLLLRGFESATFNGVMGGAWKPFSQMTQAEREQVLRAWAFSRLFMRRKGFQAFKRLILFMGYSNPSVGEHPLWKDIRYPGAFAPTMTTASSVLPLTMVNDITLTTDVLVIGSGAGGGVVAGELATAGFEVLVVEKGDYFPDEHLLGNERLSTETMYEKKGALTTQDTSMMILAGSTLGGGTTINWAGSLRTPDNVLEEWARDYGFEGAISPEYKASMDAVSARMNVNSDECALNGNNAQLVKGSEKLGYPVEIIPRNVKGCEDCGYCNFGCSFGAKQSTVKTYLQDAVKRGAKIVVRATVERITHAQGKATGAIMSVRDDEGNVKQVTIKANTVVVSAGSINTPAILRRSGLTHNQIGANLHLHPVTVIFSLFDEPIRTWQGAPMTRVVKKFNNLDGKGYGVVLEVAPAHPALTAATLPWMGGEQHKRLISHMECLANVIVIARDTNGGRISIDKHGQPVVEYKLHAYDRKHLQTGMLEALKIHQAAGAREISSPHNERQTFVNDGKSDFGAYLKQVEAKGLKPNDFALFSAHQMSSCRIAAHPRLGATKPNGELWELKGCYVVDGSALPTATGVNPMLSILTLAHYLVQGIKADLATS
jgi:choline dehydrogenase-like flavoprotein